MNKSRVDQAGLEDSFILSQCPTSWDGGVGAVILAQFTLDWANMTIDANIGFPTGRYL